MSIGPQIDSAPPPADPESTQPTRRLLKWHRRVLGICFAIFALEVGIFLFVFPWLRSWDLSWVPLQSPQLRTIWMSPYFRGALSGLGSLNLYVGVSELGRQLRQWLS
jgi:hypothetical protein